MPTYRRIMLASDFSRASGKAFTTAVSLCRRLKARLILVHVLAPVTTAVAAEYVPPSVWDQLEASSHKWGKRRLDALTDKARRAGIGTTALLLRGDATETIVDAARRQRVDLLVLGTHGRTGLERMVMGSVAARVIGGAPCPVLTVRGR
ncbi:MAG TPA: universal stress protein [Vicinamibacterales bacterium]|nr:universal stress protein [Vicinamibacterales bacterium]